MSIFWPSKFDRKKVQRNDVDILLIEITSNKVRRKSIDFSPIQIIS